MAFSRVLACGWMLLAGCASLPAKQPSDTQVLQLPLASTEGEYSTLGKLLSAHRATVLVFWSSGCPCVVRYQGRIEALAAKYASSNIAFLQVSSNAGENTASLQEAARIRQLALPIWRDEGGWVAQAVGAKSTPTVVLLSPEGRVLFRGYIDNERLPGESGREPWLENALEAFVQGRPYPSKSPTYGCTVTRSLSSLSAAGCHSPNVASSQATSSGASP